MRLPLFTTVLTPGPINGYSAAGLAAKRRFLRTALRFLLAVGRSLAERHEMGDSDVRMNPGGIAVSGEVYGEFRRDGEDVGVFVEVGTSCAARAMRSDRVDDVVIRAVWPKPGRSRCAPQSDRTMRPRIGGRPLHPFPIGAP